MALATLSIDLVAKLAQFEADLGKATKATEAAAGKMAAAFNVARTALGGLSGALVADFAANFVRNTVAGVDALNDLADATGASIENISALEDVAARTGTSFETVGDALVKLNKYLADAAPGSQQAAALRAIGLSAEDLRRQDPAEALRQLSVALSGFADDQQKAYFVQDLFGKSLRTVAPLLNDLASQTKLVGTVTSEQAKEAERFNQQLAQLEKNSVDTARALVGSLLPALNQALQAFIAFSKGPGLFSATLEVFKGNVFSDAAAGLRFYSDEVTKLDKQLARLQKQSDSPLASVAASSEREAAKLREQRAQLEKFAEVYRKLQAAQVPQADYSNEGRAGSKPSVKVPGKPDPEIGKAADQYRRLAESIGLATASAQEEITTGDRLTPLQTLRLKILQDLASGQTKYSQAQRDSLAAAAQSLQPLNDEIEAMKRLLALVRERADLKARDYQAGNDAAAANDQAERDRLRSMLGATSGGRMDAAMKDIEFLNRALTQGVGAGIKSVDENGVETFTRMTITTEQWADAVRSVTAGLGSTAQETKTFADELGLAFSSAFEDAIVSGSSLRDLLSALQQDLLRMATRKLVTEPLANGFGDFFAAITGSKSSGGGQGLGAMAGNFLAKLFAGPFAEGGYIPPGQFGLVGERGPELMSGGRTGKTITPLAAGGGSSITINYHMPASGLSKAAQQQVAADTMRMLRMAESRNN